MAKIAIIGGGIIGSSIAYYLALASHAADVVVVEPDPTYEFAATPRATGGIRQLFTVPENIRIAQYGHEIYGQFETLMGSGRRPRADRLPSEGLSLARLRQERHRRVDGQLAGADRP